MKRFFCILLGVMMMFTLTVSASAFSIFDTLYPENVPEDVQGTAPITESEACYIYQQYTGLSADEVNAYCVFVTDYERQVVWVYDTDGVKHDVVYYNNDGMIYSYGLDYAVERDTLIEIEEGVSIAFDIASKAFDFLIANPFCALMLGVGFAYTALSLIHRGVKTAKRT